MQLKKMFQIIICLILITGLGLVYSNSVISVESPNMVYVESGISYSITQGGIPLEHDLLVGQYPITFAEFDKFCEDAGREKPDDEGWGRGDRPVINVNWYDAVEYCNWLSEQQGLEPAYDTSGDREDWRLKAEPVQVEGYRLPRENEWLYVAGGGEDGEFTNRAGSDDINEVGWWAENSEGKTHPVGEKYPNELGIFDMSGNVFEWMNDRRDKFRNDFIEDLYHHGKGVWTFMGEERDDTDDGILRGGSFASEEEWHCGMWYGHYQPRDKAVKDFGFRVYRTKLWE